MILTLGAVTFIFIIKQQLVLHQQQQKQQLLLPLNQQQQQHRNSIKTEQRFRLQATYLPSHCKIWTFSKLSLNWIEAKKSLRKLSWSRSLSHSLLVSFDLKPRSFASTTFTTSTNRPTHRQTERQISPASVQTQFLYIVCTSDINQKSGSKNQSLLLKIEMTITLGCRDHRTD